ncbi:MAG: hypothetical protein K940chlam3_01309, partial [Chlamydiae bacterium]|nr:hypothetical protein [Chlamydiota bacterium]
MKLYKMLEVKMKPGLILLPIISLSLSGCGTMEQMNRLIDESTESIQCNRIAVERSTEVI